MLLKSKDFRDLNQPGSYKQPLKKFRIDLFHNDVKREKMKLTWNLIGSTFFASQSNFMSHRESAFDVIIRKVYSRLQFPCRIVLSCTGLDQSDCEFHCSYYINCITLHPILHCSHTVLTHIAHTLHLYCTQTALTMQPRCAPWMEMGGQTTGRSFLC